MAYTTLKGLFTGICDAIRTKKGTTGLINHQDIPNEILNLPSIDVSGVTATAADVLSPKVIVDANGEEITGTMPTVTQATPSISVSSAGKITASSTQSGGYVASGTKSATKQLTTKAATTWTPTTSNQTISSGTYLTGTQTIKGDSNLKAANIKSGTSIFGVTGTYKSSLYTQKVSPYYVYTDALAIRRSDLTYGDRGFAYVSIGGILSSSSWNQYLLNGWGKNGETATFITTTMPTTVSTGGYFYETTSYNVNGVDCYLIHFSNYNQYSFNSSVNYLIELSWIV